MNCNFKKSIHFLDVSNNPYFRAMENKFFFKWILDQSTVLTINRHKHSLLANRNFVMEIIIVFFCIVSDLRNKHELHILYLPSWPEWIRKEQIVNFNSLDAKTKTIAYKFQMNELHIEVKRIRDCTKWKPNFKKS